MVAADEHARRTLSSLFAEYRMVARDGSVVWVSEKAAVVTDETSGVVYWQGLMVDITDRKRTEAAFAASERQFRSIFDAAAIGVMTVSLEGRILEANPTLERVCDYPPGALHGRLLHDYLEPGDGSSLERFIELVSGAHDRCQLEHLFRRNDQSLMWCRTVMALVRDDSGKPAHVTAMLEDISDRKLVEADLVHRTLLTNSLRAPFTIAGQMVTLTASMGVAYSSDSEQSAEDILRNADTAMYLAKQRGRNRVEAFGHSGEAAA